MSNETQPHPSESLKQELSEIGCLGPDFEVVAEGPKCLMVKNRNQWEAYTFGSLGWDLYTFNDKGPIHGWAKLVDKMLRTGFPH